MIALAEIADKIPTIAGMWLVAALIALPLVVAVVLARRTAWFAAPIGVVICVIWLADAFDSAYGDDPMREMIWQELGLVWIINSFLSGTLPVLAVLIAAVTTWRNEHKDSRPYPERTINASYDPDELVAVWWPADLWEATAIRDALVEEGVPCHLGGEDRIGSTWFEYGVVPSRRLYVRRQDVDRARRFIESRDWPRYATK